MKETKDYEDGFDKGFDAGFQVALEVLEERINMKDLQGKEASCIMRYIGDLQHAERQNEVLKKDLNELCKEAHRTAKAKGFYDKPLPLPTPGLLMLIVSELSEALECDRKGMYVLPEHEPILNNWPDDKAFKRAYERCIKETFEAEMADSVIRIFDLCGYLGIDLGAHVAAKMRYNKLRDWKHGRRY